MGDDFCTAIGGRVGIVAAKVVGFALKLTLWCVLAGVAYFFFAQVFGWPLPAFMA